MGKGHAKVCGRRTVNSNGALSLTRLASLSLSLLISLSSAAAWSQPQEGDPDPLRNISWFEGNKERLDQLIIEYGLASPDFDPTRRPLAIFDWDNTVTKNDIGAATVAWVVQHGLVLQPEDSDWSRTTPYLTEAAALRLREVCGTEIPAGEPLPTPQNTACAEELVSIYRNASLLDGTAAFAGYNHRMFKPTAAWQSILLAGYSPDEVRAIASAVIEHHTTAPIGATMQIGSIEGIDGYIRIYEPIAELIAVLQDNGFDVWVVSASPQYVVEPFAARVGVAADRVIGIRTDIAQDGGLTTNFQACGPIGPRENSLMTFADGKRCWINQVILGIEGREALERAPERRRPVFVAGDATTDVTMLRDATVLRLVFNRNKPELMCYAYDNEDGRWLINPMFIDPKPPRSDPYPCSTTACRLADGTPAPCLNEQNVVISDQRDSVY